MGGRVAERWRMSRQLAPWIYTCKQPIGGRVSQPPLTHGLVHCPSRRFGQHFEALKVRLRADQGVH